MPLRAIILILVVVAFFAWHNRNEICSLLEKYIKMGSDEADGAEEKDEEE